MRSVLVCLAVIIFCSSCNDNQKSDTNSNKSRLLNWTNKYEVFDEPGSQGIADMKFYLLMVSENLFDSLTILSVRQDSNKIQGFYKRVPFDQIPALFPNTNETKSFTYLTTRFALSPAQIDSIKQIIERNNLISFKDTINSRAVDGSMREIIFYDSVKLYDLYRGYVFEKDIEPAVINSIKEIMKLVPVD
jgi:hypothetical protein